MQKIAQETQIEKSEEGYQPKILQRGAFRKVHEKNKQSRHQENRKSNIRLIIIILFLFFIAYLLIR